MNVHSAVDLFHLRLEFTGQSVILFYISTAELNVNCSGLSKVQNLGDDVRGLKVNLKTREKLWQLQTQAIHVILSGGVICVQCNLDFTIKGSNRACVAVSQVNTAVR